MYFQKNESTVKRYICTFKKDLILFDKYNSFFSQVMNGILLHLKIFF